MSQSNARTHAAVTADPIDFDAVTARVGDDTVGAVVSFRGIVRDHDNGRGVSGIDYSNHPDAEVILTRLATEIAEREDVTAVAIEHRVGHLDVGEDAMVVAVAASHRAGAFKGCFDLVNEVKAQVPIWKNQEFTDGGTEWTGLPAQD